MNCYAAVMPRLICMAQPLCYSVRHVCTDITIYLKVTIIFIRNDTTSTLSANLLLPLLLILLQYEEKHWWRRRIS